AQLARNKVTTIHGNARFVDPHTLEVTSKDGTRTVRGERILIACGTRPASTPDIPIDGKKIFNSDQLARVDQIPRHLIVVGAAVIGVEYALMLAALGGEVTVIDQRPKMLDFVDTELVDALAYHMRKNGVTFRLGEKVVGVAIDAKGRVVASLESGKNVPADALLYAVGRHVNTDRLA